jgi:hypothetical protein
MKESSNSANTTSVDICKRLGVRASSEEILELIHHVQSGVPVAVAATAAGVSIEDAQRPLLAMLIAKADAGYEAALVRVLSKAAMHDWHAAAFVLERRYPERWGRRQAERKSTEASTMRIRVAVPEAAREAAAADVNGEPSATRATGKDET